MEENNSGDLFQQDTIQGTAAFLRSLADELEGQAREAAPSFITGFRKLKITLTRKADTVALKCKIRYASGFRPRHTLNSTLAYAGFVMPDFGHLKKRLATHADAISQRLNNGSMPAHLMVSSFCNDIRLLCSCPECAIANRDEFEDLCEEWRDALDQHHLAEAQEKWHCIQIFLFGEAHPS